MKKLLILPLAFLSLAASGPRVIEVDTPKMPLVAATLYFPFGSASEVDGQRGATRAVFEWLESGTKRLSAEQVSDGFLASGARYLYNVDINYSTATVEAPESYFPEAWRLMLEVLREPKLSESDLKNVAQKQLTEKKTRLTNALGVAKDLAYAAVYAGSPEGSNPLGFESDIAALSVEKATAYYQGSLAKGPSAVFVSNSMPAAVRRDVEQSLSSWVSPTVPHRAAKSSLRGKSLVIIERPGSTQAYVAFARKGPGYFDEGRRYAALATELLGGNGSGGDNLLFKELRSKQGLTYHASLQTWRRPDRDAIVGLTFGANENISKLVGEYLRLWDGFMKSTTTTSAVLAEAERRVDGTAAREGATVYEAMMRAVQMDVAGGIKKEGRSSLNQSKFQQAKQTWLSRENLVVLAFADSKAVKDTLLSILGPNTKVEVLPETADWTEIGAAVVKLTTTSP